MTVIIKFLFLFGCCLISGCSKSTAWDLDTLEGSDSAQLIHRSPALGTGIDVQFFRSEETIQGFLVLHGRPVPVDKKDPQFVKVYLATPERKREFSVYRREGGQILVLPNDGSQFLIDALLSKTAIEISFYSYKETLSPANFPKLYDRLLNPFPISNPFRTGL